MTRHLAPPPGHPAARPVDPPDGPFELAGLPSGPAEAWSGDRVGARLAEVAGLLSGRDRTMGRVVALLVDLGQAGGLHERLGGMTLQVWLEQVCRIPGPDARALLGAVDVLARLPALAMGLRDGWVSWVQTAAICRAARQVPVGRLADLDVLVGAAMVDRADVEPDALVADVWTWVDAAQPSRLERAERARDRAEFVSLAPRLFGGGSLYGELGAVSFATVAEALDATLGPPPATAPQDVDGMDGDEVDVLLDGLDDQRRAHTRGHGARMARRLVDLCEQSLAGNPGEASSGRRARPLVMATVGLDALLDADRTPGWLLHTLAGGRMKLSAAALRRLVDDRGADLRSVVLDDCGHVVGVGKTRRIPPGWLRQAIWARDLAVRDPDGATPVRRADLDHTVAWPDGPTDVANLHPLGRTWHNRKTSKTWTVTRTDDGTTVWRHRRHGWVLRIAATRPHTADRPARAGPAAPPPVAGPPRHPPERPPDRQLALTGVP